MPTSSPEDYENFLKGLARERANPSRASRDAQKPAEKPDNEKPIGCCCFLATAIAIIGFAFLLMQIL